MPQSTRSSKAAEIREVVRPVNRLAMNVASCGEGPAMVLLHGFPDHWRVWRPLMERLADDFTLHADQRGYNLTSRPADVSAYGTEHLVADIAALIASISDEPVCLVAHDWGATLAFWLAMQQPDRLKCVTILNGAHPYLLQDAIWDDPRQRAASQYFETLRSEAFENLVKPDAGESIAAEWFGPELASGRMSRQDYDGYLKAWRSPGAWEAMLNWYRAAPFIIPPIDAPAPENRWTHGRDYLIKVPVQVIWGAKDTVFSSVLVDDLNRYAPCLDVHCLPDAGHVPQRDAPDTCADLIRSFAERFL
ncbi:alpha/beta hydrolase [Hyphomonas sp.]|uniref:alpha/beta fold hydrolase n=1 Tax=Hyphomonas sp. TaxID=87 RepID=UPI0025BC902F|nr:alpha/beta hydrolase [Hyphomonas sp.]